MKLESFQIRLPTASATFYSHDHFNFCAICKEIKIDDVICLYFYVQGINCGHMITGSDVCSISKSMKALELKFYANVNNCQTFLPKNGYMKLFYGRIAFILICLTSLSRLFHS